MNHLPCMNCKKDVGPNDGRFFASVFLCEGCATMAQHFFDRLQQELVFLQTMAKEAIRTALVTGKFNFPEGPAGEPSKRDVLEAILKFEEQRTNKEPACPPTPSSDATPPHVQTLMRLGAKENESSSKPSPQG